MFLPWNIARSVEAMFSRWALRRLFKFALKKKLGQFIFGDVDLDQLDVQLYEGTIQLNDLALNVDYLNEKLGASASVIIKEGSIGSLLVKMPWKAEGFQVEVDELEIVLAPIAKSSSRSRGDDSSVSRATNDQMHGDIGKASWRDMGKNPSKTTTANVHEGVKTIAKMIKIFLTSFHVKIKKLIIAFEPYLEKDENKFGCCRTLVLRILETECGTCVSEDTVLSSDGEDESFLGISRLTNFVNFQGATVELLDLEYVDSQTCLPCGSGSSISELFSGSYQPHSTTPIATGKKGGLSGKLKLSIPWKNGSLDVRKVDADVNIDPVELRFQPSTIKWFLILWETYKNLNGGNGGANGHYKPTESIYFNSASHFQSSTCFPAMFAADKAIRVDGGFSSASSLSRKEALSEAMLHGSHLIHDWMPNSVNENEKDGAPEEIDLGASVEQFFECFDGIRHSQSALGCSGMWNWTCSVFNALTAASSLASGSLHVPSEQQHVQTNLKVTFAGVSIILCFQDEVLGQFCDPEGNQSGVCSNAHYLGAECKGILVVFQVCPQEMRIDGTVKAIEIAEYSGNKDDVVDLSLQESNGENKSETFLTQHLQAYILDALPSLSSFTEAPDANALVASEFPLGSAIKTKLLSTSGITRGQVAVTSNLSVGSLTATRSFSLQLPQFVFWVDFRSIFMFLDLLNNIGKSAETEGSKIEENSVNGKHGPSLGDEEKDLNLDVAALTSTTNWRINVSMPNARLVLCPVSNGKNAIGYSAGDQFLAIDFHSPSILEDEKFQETSPISNASLWKRHTMRTTCSLHLSVGNLNIYLVNLMCQDDELDSSDKSRQKASAQKILSVCNRAGSLSKVSMFWQEGPMTGPWVIESVKYLATPEEYEGRENFTANGFEYATVASANKNNLDDGNSQTREDIILSSAFFLHVRLFPVTVDIGSSQYGDLHHLLGQMIGVLSDMPHNPVSVEDTKSVCQTSILIECESLELSIRPDIKVDIRTSLQNELPGSWHCLKLKIQKLEVLSVSNVGGIRNANFFWLSHKEGTLWGTITGVPDHEFLLISCSNSTRKRGDGGGSNALSSRSAGSDIIYLWDPRNLHAFTSITISCITIVAVGGRLDWLDVISSFFSLPSSEAERVDGDLLQGDLNTQCESSFVLKFLDVGLSYEPHMKSSVVGNLHTKSKSSHFNEETGEPFVACLLAASSLYLSNTKLEESLDVEHKIRVQDLGLLLCSTCQNLCGTYSVEHLHEMGFVRVAWEALVEAKMRTNCKDGLFWDLECSKSHIYIETCHDTTRGLIRLAAQLQQLFAPELEDSLVHLQNRWDDVQLAQDRNEFSDADSPEPTLSTSPVHVSSVDTRVKLGMAGLMDEICEDAFHLGENQAWQFGFHESQVHCSVDERLLREACSLSTEKPGVCSDDVYFDGSVPLMSMESSESSLQNSSFPEIIEGYCLSDLRSLSKLSIARQSSPEIVRSTTRNCGDGDLGKGCNGWYGDAINIVENHISEESEEADACQFSSSNFSSMDSLSDDFGKATGCIVLKNIDVCWRMYNGSDWHACKTNDEPPTNYVGRETNACLELTLTGTQFQYLFYPVGGLCASKLSVSVQDFHLCDGSKTAPWKLILGCYHSKNHPRESASNAFKLDLEAVRPDPLTPLEEYRLCVAFLPMLLHLHQSQLDFLVNFFGEKDSSARQSSEHHQNSNAAVPSVTRINNLPGHAIIEEALLPYFQKFDIWPFVLQVDYSPCRVDLAALGGGNYVELVNLVPWKGVKLQLKHVHAVGVYGWGSVCETIIGEWLEDISRHQIHKVLRGIPTIRSLVAVGNGAAKLVSLPVESYRKDQRVLKGMQRGTIAFLRSLSLEAVGLGVHLAAGAHDVLLQAEYILASIPRPVSRPQHGQTKLNVRCNQPKNAQQGIQQACESLSDGLGKSASALVRTPLKNYQRGASVGSALATAIRAVPAAAIAPVTACASAAHHTLLGIRNSLDPEHKKESMEKYLGPSQPRDWN